MLPPMTIATLNDPILERFRAAVTEIYGDRLERLVLFGSRGRGDAQPDSDYDVAVFCATCPTAWRSWTDLLICALLFLTRPALFSTLSLIRLRLIATAPPSCTKFGAKAANCDAAERRDGKSDEDSETNHDARRGAVHGFPGLGPVDTGRRHAVGSRVGSARKCVSNWDDRNAHAAPPSYPLLSLRVPLLRRCRAQVARIPGLGFDLRTVRVGQFWRNRPLLREGHPRPAKYARARCRLFPWNRERTRPLDSRDTGLQSRR